MKIEIFIRDDLTDELIAKLIIQQLHETLGSRYREIVDAMIREHQARRDNWR